MFRSISQMNTQQNYHKPPQTMTWTTTNDDMNHHKSPQTMTEPSITQQTHDINHHEP